MNDARQWLRPQDIELDVRAGGKRAALGEVSRLLASRTGAEARVVLEAREKQGEGDRLKALWPSVPSLCSLCQEWAVDKHRGSVRRPIFDTENTEAQSPQRIPCFSPCGGPGHGLGLLVRNKLVGRSPKRPPWV
jgi:hypothetical protein